jgi:hypothetical protein
MTTTYLSYDNPQIVIQVYNGVPFYTINVLENYITTSSAMLGSGVNISSVMIQKEKYMVRLEGDTIFLAYKEGDIKIY